MAESIFSHWEEELNKLKNDYSEAIQELNRLKEELYSLNYSAANKPRGRFIHDDHRLVLSAPEIIIGNVNLAGILNPEGGSTIIIRGNQVSMEGAGEAGKVSTRAAVIQQTAENPGIDGSGHKVEALSSVVTQACCITLDSSSVPQDGAFLSPITAVQGEIKMNADAKIDLSAQKSKEGFRTQIDKKLATVNSGISTAENALKTHINSFKNKRKAIEKLLDEHEKIDKIESALRTDYADLDELNLQIDEKSVDIVGHFYSALSQGGNLIELKRMKKYFTNLKTETDKINEKDFKEKTTGTAITLNSEKIQLSSMDGDNHMRTNKEAEVKIAANTVKIEGAFDDKGLFEKNSVFSVNTRKVELSTAGKKNVQKEDNDNLKAAEFQAEGDVIITSKNITMQSVNSKVNGNAHNQTGLTEKGTINLRAKTINLSTAESKDAEVGKDGLVTKGTYTADGNISLLSKNVSVLCVDSKIDNGKAQETDLPKEGKLNIRAANFSVSATDKDGKSTGKAYINAKAIDILSRDTDPKSGEVKEVAAGSNICMSAENITNYSKKSASYASDETMSVSGKKSAVFQGQDTAEIKQGDKNFLSLSGGNSELSGSKNTLKGDTTINVLKSPSITVDNLTASKAIKAPNITDGIMVDTKNTSTSSSKLKSDEKAAEKTKNGKTDDTAKLKEELLSSLADLLAHQAIEAALDEGFKEDDNQK